MGQQRNKGKIFKNYPETNENESTITQNLWNKAKVDLGGKFIAILVYHKKDEVHIK